MTRVLCSTWSPDLGLEIEDRLPQSQEDHVQQTIFLDFDKTTLRMNGQEEKECIVSLACYCH